uniref:ATP-dependent RNA helicase n=1 Tax=Sciurus vulgaris TaxID=55149 RepID=A0A8D2DCA0_SCIVU
MRFSLPSKATKRKHQASSEAPPAKRKKETSFLPAKKTSAEKTQRAFRGNAQNTFSPKKNWVNTGDGKQEKPCIKTSSLFKNNPDIPELHRPVVQQVREQVFAPDTFQELGLHPHLISTINTVLKMTTMTSVQKRSIPVLLEGRDALVRSQTGSGHKEPVSPSPTSLGTTNLVSVFSGNGALTCSVSCLKSEKARLRKGINILISTPGRLVDHIKSTKNIHFRRMQWLILDEADRILDLGFEKDVTVILNAVNAQCQKRQNVLLSATLSEGVTRLADISLHSPVNISVLDKSHDQSDPRGQVAQEVTPQAADKLGSFAIPESLDQHVVLVPSKLRLVCLAAFLLQKGKLEQDQKVIVFFSSCELVEFHYHLFQQTLRSHLQTRAPGQLASASPQLAFLRLHGDMAQEVSVPCHRSDSWGTWRQVRGIALPYSAPSSPAEYIHRIGRTARIGCRGSSLLILAPSEAEYVNSLAAHKINISEVKMEDILSILIRDDCFKGRRRNQKSHAVGPQEIRARATVLQTVFEDYVHSSQRTVSWAKKALQSFIRAYAAYPRELKHIFHVRSLHLGHVAKSFGLRDAPRNLSVATVKRRKANLKSPVRLSSHPGGGLRALQMGAWDVPPCTPGVFHDQPWQQALSSQGGKGECQALGSRSPGHPGAQLASPRG